ncbi:MAG: hypothetical protein AAF725_20835, partial [Acidobacteriota bacterium]
MRLNERRDRLIRSLRSGLMLAGPPEIKVLVRSAAPDLWSSRSLVIDLSPPAPSLPLLGQEDGLREKKPAEGVSERMDRGARS